MHSNTKAQHLPKSTALLYNLSYQLVLQPTAPGHILQIFLRVTIQNQIRVAQRIIVDEVIQFRPLRHGHVQCILDPGAVDGNRSPIPEQQLHAAGVHVEFAGSFIVLHVCVPFALRHSYSGLSRFLMIRSKTLLDGSKGFILFSEEYKKSEPFSYWKKVRILLLWCTSRDSNPGPTD